LSVLRSSERKEGRGETYIGGINDLVGGRVGEDGLGVDTGLVGEGGETGNVVVEGNVDLDRVGDEILDGLELVQVVLALDVIAVGDNHAGHQATQRSDTVALTDSDDRGVDVSGTGLEGTVCVCNGAARVVVEVALDVAADDAAQGSDQVVDLAGGGTADGVGDTDSVDADLVDGSVEREKVDQVGSERVLGRESDFEALGLDELDDLDGSVLEIRLD